MTDGLFAPVTTPAPVGLSYDEWYRWKEIAPYIEQGYGLRLPLNAAETEYLLAWKDSGDPHGNCYAVRRVEDGDDSIDRVSEAGHQQEILRNHLLDNWYLVAPDHPDIARRPRPVILPYVVRRGSSQIGHTL